MRWWLRFVLTLLLGPLVWWVASGYVATQQGSTFVQWLQAIPKVLPEIYLIYTLPALLLCAVLYAVDRLWKIVSLDFVTVIISPVLAYGLAWAVVHSVPESHVQAAGSSLPFFLCFGLVWGLTIREPRRRQLGGRSDGEFVDALLP